MKMRLEQNQISRDWTILHNGRRFYVNLTESDGQTLALCNRDNWEVWEQTEDGVEELSEYVFKSSTPREKKRAEQKGKEKPVSQPRALPWALMSHPFGAHQNCRTASTRMVGMRVQ